MIGPRMLMGAVIGGALVYFLDPDNGPRRRSQALAWWEKNREPVLSTAASAASTAQATVSETSARVGEKVSEVGGKVSDLQSKVRREVQNANPLK
jgi:gas vesicle protein